MQTKTFVPYLQMKKSTMITLVTFLSAGLCDLYFSLFQTNIFPFYWLNMATRDKVNPSDIFC